LVISATFSRVVRRICLQNFSANCTNMPGIRWVLSFLLQKQWWTWGRESDRCGWREMEIAQHSDSKWLPKRKVKVIDNLNCDLVHAEEIPALGGHAILL
jgi:hypothetical protein